MRFRGRGYKAAFIRSLVRIVKTIFPPGYFYNSPRAVSSCREWLQKFPGKGSVFLIHNSNSHTETPPEIFNYQVSARFTRYYKRTIPPTYVAEISNGAVYGWQTNTILLSRDIIAEDLTRQFGAYGGLPASASTLIRGQLKLPQPKVIQGRVAVISTSGADNFHHWLYDCLPRVHLLKASGKFESIDKFLISMSGHPFQQESLALVGIDPSRIINPLVENQIHYQAETLVVPSLPSVLGTVSPWVVNFLQLTFNTVTPRQSGMRRIYISRKNAVTRKIINNEAFLSLIATFGITEIFPEDYCLEEFSGIMSNADFIISIHGSGLSNLCFASSGAVVVDILAPYHQDGYYWMIANIRRLRYIGFFANGVHPHDEEDLVKNKRDDDIHVDVAKLHALLLRELKNESTMAH